jgi:hypothetical protein
MDAEPKIYAPAIASFLDLPSFFLDHLALSVSPHILMCRWQTTAVSSNFLAWLEMFNAQNTGQAVELASHGYVVISTQHNTARSSRSSPMGQWLKKPQSFARKR